MEKEHAQIKIVETDDGVRIEITGKKLADLCSCCCPESGGKSNAADCCSSDDSK